MNLWDKALKMGLVILVPSLFFLACDEELNNVGENGNGDQFNLLFEEFVLPSHVIIDSLNTANGELLTGSYSDPVFGEIASEAYTEFIGLGGVDLSNDRYVFDSLRIFLRLSPYFYGASSGTSVSFKIHELTEEISDAANRTNYSEISYDPSPIGEASYVLDEEIHESITSDTLLTFEIDDLYFNRIQDTLGLIAPGTTNGKYTTLDISPETGFYGFAILAEGDKVVGVSSTSQMSITYHVLEEGVHKDTANYVYSFNANRYNKITSDRSGTPIAEVKDDMPNTPYFPDNNLRYVQNGVGISTELDFNPFFDFIEDKNHMVINSLELSFGMIENTGDFVNPQNLILINTNEDSEFVPLDILGIDFITVQADFGTQENVAYEEETGRYKALFARYFQLLYDNGIERSTTVMASSVAAGSTVDRFVVHQDSIKLKVFYTLPK